MFQKKTGRKLLVFFCALLNISMSKKLLKEMPHISNVVCVQCGEKFVIDPKVELWTNDSRENQKLFTELLVANKLPFECPNCHNFNVVDLAKGKTHDFDTVVKSASPSVREFFRKALSNKDRFMVLKDDKKPIIHDSMSFEIFANSQ